MKWVAEQMPELSGRTVVVPGANSGLGLIAAREPAREPLRLDLEPS